MSQFEYMSPCRFDNLHSIHTTLITLFFEGTVCPHVCHTPAPIVCGDGEMSCDGGSNNGCPNANTCHPEGFQNVLFVKVYSNYCYFIQAQLVLTSATLLLQLFVGLTRPYLVMEDPLLAAPIQIHVIQKVCQLMVINIPKLLSLLCHLKVLNVHRSATVLLR